MAIPPPLAEPVAQRPGRTWKRLQRLPVRRIVLTILTAGILLGATVGALKTLTLPEGQAYTAARWRDFIVQGVARGSIYALIAIGYSLVYGILLMINFAHGEVFMMGAFASFFVAASLDRAGFLEAHPLVSLAVLLVVAALVSMLTAVLLERVAYRPLRSAPRLVPLITAIGASLFLQYTALGFFGPQPRTYPDIPRFEGRWGPFDPVQVLTVVAAVVGMLALGGFVRFTRTGKSMRAVAYDREIASLMGIGVDRVVVVTFAVGGLMAGVAGVMFALQFGNIQFQMGVVPGIKAFTAAVLGGIGSITGAALGGLLLGVLEAVGPILFLQGYGIPSPTQIQDAFAFTVLVLVLLFRPGGILGTGEAEKV